MKSSTSKDLSPTEAKSALLRRSYLSAEDLSPPATWQHDLMRRVRSMNNAPAPIDMVERIVWLFAKTGCAAAFALVLIGLQLDGGNIGSDFLNPISDLELSSPDEEDIVLWEVDS